jgi:hypothetical protein
MHTDYADIRGRIQTEPLWFDEVAVPRYCPFAPDAMANIYAREAVLVLAVCQTCLRHFQLAISRPSPDAKDLATAIHHRRLHYGDPPNVGCCDTGPTETVVELRVLEYWRRLPSNEWKREPSFEVGVVAEHIADDERFADYADWHGNPPYLLSFAVVTEQPGGAQFKEIVEELLTRYPTKTRETIEDVLRSTWKTGVFAMHCLRAAEQELPQ